MDVVAAQTQVATFEQALFAAQQALTAAENNLKTRMLPDAADLLWSTAVVPETQVETNVMLPALDEALNRARRVAPSSPRAPSRSK